MTPAAFAAAGRAITGEDRRWRAPLARLLGLTERQVYRLAAGENRITAQTERLIALFLAHAKSREALPDPSRTRKPG